MEDYEIFVSIVEKCLEEACDGAAGQPIALKLVCDADASASTTWVLETGGARRLASSASVSHPTMSCRASVFLHIARKELSISRAVMTGKLVVSGGREHFAPWKPALARAKEAIVAAIDDSTESSPAAAPPRDLAPLAPWHAILRAIKGVPDSSGMWRWQLWVRIQSSTSPRTQRCLYVSRRWRDEAHEEDTLRREIQHLHDVASLELATCAPAVLAAGSRLASPASLHLRLSWSRARGFRVDAVASGAATFASGTRFALPNDASPVHRAAARDLALAAIQDAWRVVKVDDEP